MVLKNPCNLNRLSQAPCYNRVLQCKYVLCVHHFVKKKKRQLKAFICHRYHDEECKKKFA